MPFKCSICELDIQVGEELLADEKMDLAHKTCVNRMLRDPGSAVVIPSVTVPPPPPRPPSPPTAPEPCVPSRAPSVCVECDRPCIAICPYCQKRVHQSYGYDGGPACSALHEAKCPGARDSRNPAKVNLEKLETDMRDNIERWRDGGLLKAMSTPKNGTHKKPRKRARR